MQKQNGFTLIELLVVISIIGFIASTTLVAVNSARAKARDAKRKSDFHQLSNALNLYFAANGDFPPNPVNGQGCQFPYDPARPGQPFNFPGCLEELVGSGLISAIPKDPQYPGQAYSYYNYGLAGQGAVINFVPEIGSGESPCNFATGSWCDPSFTGGRHYCLCHR